MSADITPVPPGPEPHVEARPPRTRDLSQFVVVGVLVIIGLFAIISTWDVVAGFAKSDPLGPRAFPAFIGVVCLVLAAILAWRTLAGDVPEEDGGEDVDLSQRPDWATVGKLVAIFALNVAMVSFLGWAITGALLFAGTAWVLGSRTPVRDLIIGTVLSVGSFYAFYVGLGVPIPPGILDGIL